MTLRGRTVLITSGPTREPLDPIRFLTNSSSGAMGFALAAAARAAGARAIVVSGPTSLAPPAGVQVVNVTTARQMLREVLRRSRRADAVIGAAAVSDWRMRRQSAQKIKRSSAALRLTLIPNPDIIKEAAARRRPGQVFVGFALETRRTEEHARGKLVRKGLDLVVANGPASLSSPVIRATLVGRGWIRRLPQGSKSRLAKTVLKEVVKLLEQRA
ncbi:MAG: phosphopantothenoylcysteine decarboxylase [Elusimicrobia bacterium]|nr:phosphopantothenoylcysteine decarboxylase [Elusimicrobiota bacterium]